MIAPRIIPRREVVATLTGLRCDKLQSSVAGSSHWVTPWGFHFYVVELPPDRVTPQWVFTLILQDIERSRPQTH